jgi:hypothetical protein
MRLGYVVFAVVLVAGSVGFGQVVNDLPSSRYGFLNLLDSRSVYGQFWFVEPLRAPEMDVDREVRLDWFHAEGKGSQSDEVKAELEYNFGLLTVEVEVPYVNNRTSGFDAELKKEVRSREEGIDNIELSARHPVFQWVSAGGGFDYTAVAAMEVAIPSGSSFSKDTELVPQLFQLLRLGEHVSVEASVGWSVLIGPVARGENSLEYNVVLGYNIEREQIKLPGVQRVIPIFELNGSTGLNHEERGENALFGTAGFRVNLNAIGIAQPRLGVGYVFPIDQGARDQMRWGIVTSLVFEF